jgi:ParB-like chromosome segregation protein Spo0J
MKEMSMSDEWEVTRLRAHPENVEIFGPPEETEEYDSLIASIRKHGIMEPLAIKTDGTVLSGHLRLAAATKLRLKTVPVRVVPNMATYRSEVEYIIRCNTDRRQLTKGQIGLAFKRLRELPKEEGGTKLKMGRPAKGQEKSRPGSRLSQRADASAAKALGVGEREARALETVFATPGVPAELKTAVNKGSVAPTPAARAVRTEAKRQGGEIKDASVLQAVANKPARVRPDVPTAHEDRMAREAAAFDRDFRALFEVYKTLDGILTRRPLKTVLGPTEHHQYATLVRDTSLRAWREIESVQGPSDTGRQMTLAVLPGGKS